VSIYLGPAWKCDTCGNISYGEADEPWDCPVCGQETCEHCFSYYMVCNKCSEGHTEEEVKQMSTEAGYDWEEQ
jgi:hypothetical protein